MALFCAAIRSDSISFIKFHFFKTTVRSYRLRFCQFVVSNSLIFFFQFCFRFAAVLLISVFSAVSGHFNQSFFALFMESSSASTLSSILAVFFLFFS